MGLSCSSAKAVQTQSKHDHDNHSSIAVHASIVKTDKPPQCPQSKRQGDSFDRVSSGACSRKNSSHTIGSSNNNNNKSVNSLPQKNDILTIIHFNDVYNIEPHDSEPVGGAARFVTKVREFADKDPLILFSGDCLNPSLMSTVTKGRQMIPVLNKIGVHAALYGNHDFDFGVDELIQFKRQTKFPWLLSNVIDNLTDTFLAEAGEKLLLNWHGRKIGIMGLIEEEWLVTLASVDPRDITYEDFVDCAERLAVELRNEGADLIIALTHMRVPNDERLLNSDADIDLILGGHDHHYEVKKGNGKVLVKSGSDFREFSKITVEFDDNQSISTTNVTKISVDASIEEDKEISNVTKEYLALIEDKMETVLGNIPVDLDGRFSVVRTQESNLGNLIADIMRMAMQTDVAILNGGSLRSDRIHQAGSFRLKDLVSILPMMDILVVIAITGEKLIKALENGVSQYPRHEGRFPQVSGIQFSFNPDLPPGERISANSVKVNGHNLDWKLEYRVCIKSYLAKGKDGYDVFKSCKQLAVPFSRNHHVTSEDVGIPTIIERERCRLEPKVEGRIRIVGLGMEKQDEGDAKTRPASPKPRGRTSRLKSVSAPSTNLMGLLESCEEDSATVKSDYVKSEDKVREK